MDTEVLVEEKVKEDYGFIPNLALSVLQNTAIVVGKTISWHYLRRPSNLAFHDLTKGKAVPKNVNNYLGFHESSSRSRNIPNVPMTSKKLSIDLSTIVI